MNSFGCDFVFIYNIFVRRISQSRKLALFKMKRDFQRMSMLCLVIAWTCLSRFKGIASTSTLVQREFTLLFLILADSWIGIIKLLNTG